MTDLTADLRADLTADPALDGLAAGRWEPCATFGADTGSPVCECGWLADDHHPDAVIRRLPTRAPRAALPRRLAS